MRRSLFKLRSFDRVQKILILHGQPRKFFYEKTNQCLDFIFEISALLDFVKEIFKRRKNDQDLTSRNIVFE